MSSLPIEKWTMTVAVTDSDGTRTVELKGYEIIYARSAMAEAYNASNRVLGAMDGCDLAKIIRNLREFRDHEPALRKALAMSRT